MQLKPGLQTVYLHFYDLFSNSIIIGELRLSGGGCTRVIPFHLTVAGVEQENFEHSQVFSESEKQAWGVETDAAGESVWASLSRSFMAGLPDLERRIGQRPCKRSDLENAEKEFDRSVTLLRSRQEELRVRNGFLPDPPDLAGAIHRVRATLRRTYAEHKRASSAVRHLRELIERGHVRRAEVDANEVGPKVASFSDLDLGFVAEAKREFGRTRRRLLIIGAVLTVAIFLAALIFKLFIRPNPAMP